MGAALEAAYCIRSPCREASLEYCQAHHSGVVLGWLRLLPCLAEAWHKCLVEAPEYLRLKVPNSKLVEVQMAAVQ